MIVECGNCKRKFRTEDTGASAGGKVVCPKCGHLSAGAESPQLHDATDGFAPPPAAPASDRLGEAGTFENLRSEVLEEISTSGSFDIRSESEGQSAEQGEHESSPPVNERGLPGDGGNWEQFVNISRTEAAPEDFITKKKEDTVKQDSGFDWEDLKIDRESPATRTEPPRMFEDEGMDEGEIVLRRQEEPQTPRPAAAERRGSEPGRMPADLLYVDMEVLSQNAYGGAQSAGRAAEGVRYDRVRFKSSRGSGIAGKIAYFFLTVLVFAVIVGGTYVILLNTGYIPRETADRIEKMVSSLIPAEITQVTGSHVVITQHQGRWLDTRNGPLYVISGMVKNESAHPVDYIKVESEFISAGQILYENTTYAGNTLSENELRVSALQDVLLKLQKKTGDVDFYDPEKLAGMNSNIKTGESIPFYAVFHPPSKILGLKYNLRVAGYESAPAD